MLSSFSFPYALLLRHSLSSSHFPPTLNLSISCVPCLYNNYFNSFSYASCPLLPRLCSQSSWFFSLHYVVSPFLFLFRPLLLPSIITFKLLFIAIIVHDHLSSRLLFPSLICSCCWSSSSSSYFFLLLFSFITSSILFCLISPDHAPRLHVIGLYYLVDLFRTSLFSQQSASITLRCSHLTRISHLRLRGSDQRRLHSHNYTLPSQFTKLIFSAAWRRMKRG